MRLLQDKLKDKSLLYVIIRFFTQIPALRFISGVFRTCATSHKDKFPIREYENPTPPAAGLSRGLRKLKPSLLNTNERSPCGGERAIRRPSILSKGQLNLQEIQLQTSFSLV